MTNDREPELEKTINSQAEEISRLKESLRLLLQAERELRGRVRSLIAGFPFGVIMVNAEHNIVALNNYAEQLLDYRANDLLNKPIRAIMPEIDSIDERKNPSRVMTRKKSGETFVGEVYATSTLNPGELFVIIQDITEKHRLEQLRSDLINMVSHDLRSPLMSVRMALDAIDEGIYGKLNNRGGEIVNQTVKTVQYLSSMVVSLLDAERVDQGTIELDFRETTIAEIIDKTEVAVKPLVEESRLRLETDYTNDVITADSDRITQVLINLVSNAIKYSPDNSTITIKAGIEGVHARFDVIDQGPGVPEEKRSIIFERYRQLEQPKTVKRQGFGLGLSICRGLVEKHHGTISVTANRMKENVFTFKIPISQGD